MHALLTIAALALLIPAIPLTCELLALSLAALFPPRKLKTSDTKLQTLSSAGFNLAVIIPAHNEALLIATTVQSLKASATPQTTIYVIAHNCTDTTAERAAQAGAHVLELNENSGKGKGVALHHGFTHALANGAQAVLIIDADSTVTPNLIPAVTAALAGGAQALQARYTAATPTNLRTRLQALALTGMNVLRPRGRSRLGLSCGIFGNGFALTAQTLQRVPYTAHSLVEDLEYHLLLIRAGIRVDFLDSAAVHGQMPDNTGAARTQRARWEGGRALMRKRHAWPLLREAIYGFHSSDPTQNLSSRPQAAGRSGETRSSLEPAQPPNRLRLIEPALDLLTIPLATGVVLTLAALTCALFAHSALAFTLAIIPLVSFALYILTAALLTNSPVAALTSLAFAPFYLAFKLATLPATRRAARQNAAWVRTDRNQP